MTSEKSKRGDIVSEDMKHEETVEETVETEEEVVSTPEEGVEVDEAPQKSELELAQERADDFENRYLRAMQNIHRRASEERQSLQRYRSQDLAKKILPSLDNLERALAVEGLTDDV